MIFFPNDADRARDEAYTIALRSEIVLRDEITTLRARVAALEGLLRCIKPTSTIVTKATYKGDWWKERDAALCGEEGK